MRFPLRTCRFFSRSVRMASKHHTAAPNWAKNVLYAAAIYNLLWGAAVIAAPMALFRWAGMEEPLYPQILAVCRYDRRRLRCWLLVSRSRPISPLADRARRILGKSTRSDWVSECSLDWQSALEMGGHDCHQRLDLVGPLCIDSLPRFSSTTRIRHWMRRRSALTKRSESSVASAIQVCLSYRREVPR